MSKHGIKQKLRQHPLGLEPLRVLVSDVLSHRTYTEHWVKMVSHCSLCGYVFSCLVGLCLHDPLHVTRPAVLAGYKSTGGLGQPLGQDGLLNLQEKKDTLAK